MREIEDRVADQNHQLFMIAAKAAGKRLVAGFYNYPFTHPLPELLLGGPKLLSIATDDERSFLLLFLLVFGSAETRGPEGNLIREAAIEFTRASRRYFANASMSSSSLI